MKDIERVPEFLIKNHELKFNSKLDTKETQINKEGEGTKNKEKNEN